MAEAAEGNPKVFLSRFEEPLTIDEVQKAPKLFDAIKLLVDKDRRPHRFILSGSTQLSAKLGIRESLTGRIGISTLYPLTLAEAQPEKPFFNLDDFVKHMACGGMPVPMFTRDDSQRRSWWQSWFETTIYRDCLRAFGSGYDPEFALKLIGWFVDALREGELPSFMHTKADVRRVKNYLQAFENIFLMRRITTHDAGIGRDIWMFCDSGLVNFLLRGDLGEGATLSLARHALLKETDCYLHLSVDENRRPYFKSSRGSPVDWVWNGIPFKVLASTQQMGWAERSLAGAMKALGRKTGFLVAPTRDELLPPKSGGIGILPWQFWC